MNTRNIVPQLNYEEGSIKLFPSIYQIRQLFVRGQHYRKFLANHISTGCCKVFYLMEMSSLYGTTQKT